MKKLFFSLVVLTAACAAFADGAAMEERAALQNIFESSQKPAAIHPFKSPVQAPVNLAPVVKREAPKKLTPEQEEAQWKKDTKRHNRLTKIGSGMMVLGTLALILTLAIGFLTGANIVIPLIACFTIAVAGYYIWPSNIRYRK